MSCKPTYKGVRYNSLEELYRANGVNTQQTQQLYSQYLNTIFPDSKVKDVVWRNDESEKNVLDTKSPNKAGQYRGKFFGTYEEVQYHGGQTRTMFPILLNITKPYNTDSSKKLDYFYTEDVNKIKQSHDGVVSVKYDTKQPYEYVVFEPEQIHILSSKKDLEMFKKYINFTQSEYAKYGDLQQFRDYVTSKNFAAIEEFLVVNNKIDREC